MRHNHEYCPTGYVIELGQELFFKEWIKRRIRCVAAPFHARYYRTQEEAEADVRKYMGYVGLTPCICRVCWVLVSAESLEDEWEYWCGDAFCFNGEDAVKFSSYEEAEDYRRRRGLQKACTAELQCFRDKQVMLAA